MATSAIYLHHERSTQAAAEADAQNREIVLDRTNLAPLGRFNDGTLWHGVTQEKPSVTLVALGVTGAITGGTTLAVTGLSTLAGGGVIAAATDSASKLQIGGSVSGKVTALTGNTTLDNTYHTLECNTTAGSFVVTLPAAAGCTGRRYAFHKNDFSLNTVTIDANASETIDGALTIVLIGNLSTSHLVIVSNGTGWKIEYLYELGSFTGAVTGCTTSPAAFIVYIRSGNMVTMVLPNSGTLTSNAATFGYSGLPSTLQPSTTQTCIAYSTTDNDVSTQAQAAIQFSASGTISFLKAGGGLSSWTNSGNKQMFPVNCTYILA